MQAQVDLETGLEAAAKAKAEGGAAAADGEKKDGDGDAADDDDSDEYDSDDDDDDSWCWCCWVGWNAPCLAKGCAVGVPATLAVLSLPWLVKTLFFGGEADFRLAVPFVPDPAPSPPPRSPPRMAPPRAGTRSRPPLRCSLRPVTWRATACCT